MGETVLYGQAVDRVRVVGRPYLARIAHDAKVHAPAAAGAALDLDIGMPFPQFREDMIEVADVIDIEALLILGGLFGPAGLREAAVVIPFEEADIVLR